MNASLLSTTVHRFICNRKTQIAAVLFSVILGFLCYAVYSRRMEEQQYVSRFTASFNSGVTRLCSQPEISLSSPFPIPDIGPLKKLPQITRFTITAQYIEGGVKHWGRWFYTCNSRHGDGIFMFSGSSAESVGDIGRTELHSGSTEGGRPFHLRLRIAPFCEGDAKAKAEGAYRIC